MKRTFTSANPALNRFLAALLFSALAFNLAPAVRAEMSARSVDGTIIGVHFSDLLDDITSTDANNYQVFSKGAGGNAVFNVTNVTLLPDGQTVALYLDQPVGEFFAVGANNVFNNNGNNLTDTATGYLGDLFNSNLGNASDPDPAGQVISFFRNAFQITSGGTDIGGTNDRCHFVYTKATGNFEMVAQVTRLDLTDSGSKVCLMARESISPGSRMVAIGLTPIIPGIGTNRLFTLVRTNTNINATNFSTAQQFSALGWLRMTRTNNTFTVYYGTNGSSWTTAGSTNVTMGGTLSLGIAVASHNNGHATTAGIRNFGVNGVRAGQGVVPTLTVSIVSNNVVAKWQRTPLDFAVQVTDTLLVGDTSSTGGNGNTNPPPNWGYLMLPTFDTTLTGTNVFMPTAGRYMTIPMKLFSNSQMFVRLTQVEKVIPDPVSVTPGIVLSQASGNIFPTNAAGTLGGFGIYTGTALGITNGTYIICPAGSSYEFSTTGTGDPVRTVLQLRKSGNLNAFPASAGSSTDYKGKITFGTSVSTTNYTFVVASTNNVAYKSSELNPLTVTINIK